MTDYTYSHNGVVLRIEHVSLAFTNEDGSEKPILRDVHETILNITRPGVYQGQVVALLGPSGIGKTQLFRILAGLRIGGGKQAGRVLLGESDLEAKPGLVGVVAQHYPLFSHRTVLGNLMVAGRQAGLDKAQAEAKANELLVQFDLVERADLYPAQLSGGQRQRVAIAQQMMCSEHFLLMDEPFSGLDPVMTAKVIELIQQVNLIDEHNTTLVVTHDISSAIAVADTLWLMGREKVNGELLPGARIVQRYDLAAMGLAWRANIRKEPKFTALSNEIRDLFPALLTGVGI